MRKNASKFQMSRKFNYFQCEVNWKYVWTYCKYTRGHIYVIPSPQGTSEKPDKLIWSFSLLLQYRYNFRIQSYSTGWGTWALSSSSFSSVPVGGSRQYEFEFAETVIVEPAVKKRIGAGGRHAEQVWQTA